MSVCVDVYDECAGIVINTIVVDGYKKVVDTAMSKLASGQSVNIEATEKPDGKPVKASDIVQFYTFELKPLLHQGRLRGVIAEQIGPTRGGEDFFICASDYHFQFI